MIFQADPSPRRSLAERLLLGCGLAIFLLLFFYLYRTEVSPLYTYMGLSYGFEFGSLTAFCLGLAFVPLFWLPLDVTRPSQMVVWFLYFMVYVPVCIAVVITGQFDTYITLKTILTIFSAYGLLCGLITAPRARLPRPMVRRNEYSTLLYLVFFAFWGACVFFFGFRFEIPSLAEIYGLREAFGEQLATSGRISGYIVQWFGKAITILLFVYGLYRRNRGMIILAIVGQLYIFSLLAEKALFFSFFFVALVMVLLRGRCNRFGLKVLGGTIGLLVLGKFQAVFFDAGSILSMTLRRILLKPGMNTAYYFEFYSYYAEKVNYAENLIGKVLPLDSFYGYDLSPGRMVGLSYMTYSDSFVVNVNANLWAEGFSDFGIAGVMVATIVLAGILWLFDSCTRNLPTRISCGILAASVIGLADGSLFTQLSTNGMLLLLMMAYLMPARGKPDEVSDFVTGMNERVNPA